jgi:hypothetical protein
MVEGVVSSGWGVAMSDVFRFFQTRAPNEAPVQQVVARGISTHATALAGSVGSSGQALSPPFLLAMTGVTIAASSSGGTGMLAATFYDRLWAAHEARDINQFIQVASNFYLTSAIRKLSDLLPISRAAYALFAGMGPIMQKAAVDNFFAQYTDAVMLAYLQNDLAGELQRVNDTVLALEALRLHGSHRNLNHTRLLKALYGLAMAHALRAQNQNWSVGPLIELFRMPLFVPGWIWDLDPCKWLKIETVAGPVEMMPRHDQDAVAELATSPLIQKMHEVAVYQEAQGRPPNPKLCDCECDDTCVPQSPCCAEVKSFVTDLLVVRETLHCYQPADIAYIENVLAGEIRSRKHESLLQTEVKQETETTITASEERDHQVSERFELSSETANTIEEDTSIAAGVTYTQKWGAVGAEGSATATFNASYGTSTSTSEKAAQNYAKDVVDRSVSKIEKSVRQLVSRSVLSRTREVNKHVFDRSGQDLTVGIYTWVSKTLKTQVFSYGRRMVYEFVLPDPGARYKALLIKAFGLDEKFLETKPLAPPRPSGITIANYLTLADLYDVDDPLPAPPDPTKTISVPVSGDYGQPVNGVGWTNGFTPLESQAVTISVPVGYTATNMSGVPGNLGWNGNTWNNASPPNPIVSVRIGQDWLQWTVGHNDIPTHTLPPLEGQLRAVVEAYNVTNFSLQLIIDCTVKAETMQAWQSAVHKPLVEAYQKQKEAYDTALAAFLAAQAEKKTAMQDYIHNRDPFVNREAERTELKGLILSWFTCQHFDRFNAMKLHVQPCGLPQMDLPEAEEQSAIIRFWEQAFDWSLMTYLFYPYFWSSKCTWTEKIVEDTGDSLFDKFMQAGAARVQVPVAVNFEDYMLYWENTGQIWGQAGAPPVSDSDPHWISMAEEIKHQQDCYQTDREGVIDIAYVPTDAVTIAGSDRYWDPVLGAIDQNAIDMDLDREIVIGGMIYRITLIQLEPNSPPYDPYHPNSMQWRVTLDRLYEGAPAYKLKYAVGAKFVGAPWIVTVPTNLVWLKNDTYCLPCYPLKECASH